MKLSTNTLAILTSFSNINKSIMIKKGNVIKTMPEVNNSPTVKAIIEDEFPVDFAIYEFKKFLQILSLFEEPELNFQSDRVEITDKTSKKMTFHYDNPSFVTDPNYEKDFKLPSVDETFTISYDVIMDVIKASKLTGKNDIAFQGKDGILYITTVSKNNKDDLSIEIGTTTKTFKMIFEISDFNMIKTQYDVELCFKGIAKFASNNLTYWIAPSNKSTYS
jgi:hypothetical protein